MWPSASAVRPNFMTTSWAWSAPGCAATALTWAGWAMALKDSFPEVPGPGRKRIVVRQIAAILLVAVIVGVAVVLIRGRGSDEPKQLRLPEATAGGSEPASHVSFLRRLIPP